MLVLFTDTDTDLTLKNAKKYGFRLVSMPFSIDGKTFYPYEDSEDFDFHSFYDQLRAGTIPKTSSISEECYLRYFEPVLKNGDDIFYAHFSRNMSQTFNAMDKAVEKLRKKYPERKILTVDTNSISIGALAILEEISAKIQAGESPEDVKKWVETERNRFALYFFADDLKFFKHSGRVSNLAGTVGTLLGVRPILNLNDEGRLVNIGKEKGRIKAVERLANYVVELGEDIENHPVIIASSDAEDLAQKLKERVLEKTGKNLKIEMISLNPTIGAHCGPDTVGICFYAKHR